MSRRLIGAALAVGFVLGGWSSEAGASYIFDITVTGKTGDGDNFSAFLTYDLRPGGCCGVNGFVKEFLADTNSGDTFSSSFSVTLDDSNYSYLTGQSFQEISSNIYYSQYDGYVVLTAGMSNINSSLNLSYVNEVTYNFSTPVIDFDKKISFSFDLNTPYVSFDASVPSASGNGTVDIGGVVQSITLTPEPDISPVPLPASLPLFGGALLVLGTLAYRKRLTNAP